MILPNELLQIPTPFDDLARLREKPNQAEGVDPIERKIGKCAIRDIRCDGCAHGINDFAPADGFADNMRPDGIPVNERKRDAMVVESDPRSASRFRRTEHGAAIHRRFLWRQTSRARQCFVAVHPKIIAPLARNERDGTHRLVQSAAG